MTHTMTRCMGGGGCLFVFCLLLLLFCLLVCLFGCLLFLGNMTVPIKTRDMHNDKRVAV